MKILIKNVKQFGTIAMQGIHQILEDERDIENACEQAFRDDYRTIVFYLNYPTNWMTDTDFRSLVESAKALNDGQGTKRNLTPDERAAIDYEKENNVVSLCSIDGEDDPSFGRCDITNLMGNVYNCEAQDSDGNCWSLTVGHEILCYFANGLD